MLALHALWDDRSDALAIWAEGDAAVVPARGALQRRPTSGRGPRPHPFAADTAAIESFLQEHDASGLALARPGAAARAEVMVALPGTAGDPDPSPQAVWRADSPPHRSSRARRGLWPFVVPALVCTPGHAIDLLLGLSGGPAPRCGASVAAWATVADLALAAVAAGRVVPALEAGADGTYRARWLSVDVGDGAGRLDKVVAAMPAVALPDAGARDARGVVGRALSAFVDAACREPLAAGTRSRALRAPRRAGADGATTTAVAWLRALAREDPVVEAPEAELAALATRLREWRAPLVGLPTSWRLCFRLVEPAEPGEPAERGAGRRRDGARVVADDAWRVDLLLQAAQDPSLLVGAADVWRAGESLRRAARTVESPHEVLLAELGRAVRVFPDLSAALEDAAPTSLPLDVDGAHRFLAEAAPALELAGFGVLLPAWWRRQGGRLGVRLRAAGPAVSGRASGGRLTLATLGTVDWEAAIGDETLTMGELRRLARLKAPLVKVRGRWTEMRPEEVERLIEFLSTPRRPVTVIDLVKAAAGTAPADAGVAVQGVVAGGVLGALLEGGLADTLEVRGTPKGFRGVLRPYQERGAAWISLLERAGLGACLADDMGLGKTATVLGVVQEEHAEGVVPGPTLVVCPTSVVGNWRREVERFTPALRVVVHHGVRRARGMELEQLAREADIVVTSYPLVERDRTALASVQWHRVVLDEAQQVKNPAAKQTQAVRQLHADRRLALTGTPVENHLGELWSIMDILNPGLFGSAASFRERFAVPIERYGDEEAAERLRVLTRPFLLRRLKTDRTVIDDLPEKMEITVRCSLTREQATLYQAVVDDMLSRIAETEGIERKGLVLAAMLRLKQVCNHPAQFLADGSSLAGRSGKLERTAELLEEVVDEGEKALVFTQFAEMGAMLQGHLSDRLGCRVGFLHGGVQRTRRDELVAEIQDPAGTMPVLVLSLKAGGTGLNLTAANHVVHYDRWWNPAVEDQATDRAYRIGQRRDVQVRKLVCAGTVEDRIDEMIEAKRGLASRVVRTGEGWLTELSTEDLADVLRLSAEELEA